jgi:hypothetical protein
MPPPCGTVLGVLASNQKAPKHGRGRLTVGGRDDVVSSAAGVHTGVRQLRLAARHADMPLKVR